jgi:hypothetical protein
MKVALILLAITTSAAFAQEPIPAAFEKERYEDMFASSPFVLATPPEPTKEPEPDSPLTNAYITSLTRGTDGRTVVYVKRQSDERGIKITGDEKDEETGISITKVNWADGLRHATVIAKYKDQTKELKFSDLPAAPAQPPPQNGPGGRNMGGSRMNIGGAPVPGAPGASPGAPASGPVPVPKVAPVTPIVPRPGGNIPRPGSGVTLQGGNNGQPSVTPNGDRRPVRDRGPAISNGAGGTNNYNRRGAR